MNRDGGITFTASANFQAAAAKARLNAAIHKAQKKLDAQVISDSNYYCPLETGMLQKSATLNTVIGSGLIVWKAPYARAQYYGEHFDHSQQHNPNACARWFEAAKVRKLDQWKRIVENEIKHN